MKLAKIIPFLAAIILLTSCFKPDHSIRVTNNNAYAFVNVTVGPASFGEVDPNTTTGYMDIPEGTNTVSGADKNNTSILLTGSVSVSGKGKHRWTMTINPNGTLAIQKDK